MDDVLHSPVRLVRACPAGGRMVLHAGRGAVVLSEDQVEITFVPRPPGGWLGGVLMLVVLDPLHSLMDALLGRPDERMETIQADPRSAGGAYDARRDRYAIQLPSERWAAFELTGQGPAEREQFAHAFAEAFGPRLTRTELAVPAPLVRGVSVMVVVILIVTMALLLAAMLLAR